MRFLRSALLLLLATTAASAQRPSSTAESQPAPSKAAVIADAVDPFRTLSASIQELTQKVAPAVVQIDATGFELASGETESGESSSVITRQRSLGSGILVTADGYIITNAHVVEGARKLRVHLHGTKGQRMPQASLEARVIGVERLIDLAVIKIEGQSLPFLQLGRSSEVRQGQLVLAFGSPLGLTQSVSMGVISSTARQISPDDPRVYIQTDAAINPGNSGGPLIDSSGRVVGINTFIFTQSGGSEGIGFAIPSDVVRYVYEQLKSKGHVHRPFIGVSGRVITPPLAEAFNVPDQQGVLVEDVLPQGPADTAGLKVGDVIRAIGKSQVNDIHQFAVALYGFQMGNTADFHILRNGQPMDLNIKIAEAPNDPMRFADLVSQENIIPQLGLFGINVDQRVMAALGEPRIPGGVLVAARGGESPYFGDMPKPGDIIHSVNGRAVNSVLELRGALGLQKSDKPLILQIERGGQLQFLVLESE